MSRPPENGSDVRAAAVRAVLTGEMTRGEAAEAFNVSPELVVGWVRKDEKMPSFGVSYLGTSAVTRRDGTEEVIATQDYINDVLRMEIRSSLKSWGRDPENDLYTVIRKLRNSRRAWDWLTLGGSALSFLLLSPLFLFPALGALVTSGERQLIFVALFFGMFFLVGQVASFCGNALLRLLNPTAYIIHHLIKLRHLVGVFGANDDPWDPNIWGPWHLMDRWKVARSFRKVTSTLYSSTWLGRRLGSQPARDWEVTRRRLAAVHLARAEIDLHARGRESFDSTHFALGCVMFMTALRDWSLQDFGETPATAIHLARTVRFFKACLGLFLVNLPTLIGAVWALTTPSLPDGLETLREALTNFSLKP